MIHKQLSHAKHDQSIFQNTYLLTVVEITDQVQASHEPPSLRPHCSSAQQWVTLELGPSSTPRQGILG